MPDLNYNERERIARRLEDVEARFEELSLRITQPEAISNSAVLARLMQQHAEMSELNDIAVNYRALREEIAAAEELLNDPEMRDMAKDELEELNARMDEATQNARIALLPKDPNDRKNVVLEVRAGAGGEEAALFAADLLRMYFHYADAHGWKAELIEDGSNDLGGVKESVALISGRNVFERLKYESGVHRVQRVPVTESSGRIHTSTATVAVLPEAEDVELEINASDLRIDTYRASGAGGQHVNRTDSAVRITHIPTGLVVTSQDQRSQIQNRQQAMRVLSSRLYDMKRREQEELYSDSRKSQVGTGDRSERIRTYNFPQGRVTDHRIGLTLYKIDSILNGDLDEIIDALTLEEQTALLKRWG